MLSDIILQQKISARKSITRLNLAYRKADRARQYNIIKIIEDERSFLNYNSDINNIRELRDVLLKTRFNNRLKLVKNASFNIMAEEPINLPGGPAEDKTENPDEDIKPAFGNLLALLEEEANNELKRMEASRMPSQNDLTRWALKDAVLEYYRQLNFPPYTKIVETNYDDRLLPKLAPDFDVIYRSWLQKLSDLTKRDDKYTLTLEEYDNAQDDVYKNETGMRGSAFEKQLDRYRKEFMEKIMR